MLKERVVVDQIRYSFLGGEKKRNTEKTIADHGYVPSKHSIPKGTSTHTNPKKAHKHTRHTKPVLL